MKELHSWENEVQEILYGNGPVEEDIYLKDVDIYIRTKKEEEE